MRTFRCCRTAVLLVAGLMQMAATPVLAQDESFRTDTLAPGVFALIRPVRPDLIAISNHVVIIDDDGVTLVDSGLTPRVARAVLAEIRRLTPKPVRHVINTHWHDDHVWGNQVFREAFPDVRIIAHPFAYAVMRDSLQASLEANKATYADALTRYEAALRTGRTSRGDSVTAGMRSLFERQAEALRWFIPEMPDMRITLPDITVDGSLVLHRPGREIRIEFLGRGNTGGDLVVFLPEERIVAGGDLIVAPIPYSFGSFLGDWAGTLDRVIALEPRVIVPGHGEPQRDVSYVRRVQGLIRHTLEQVRAAARAGTDLEQVRAAVDFGSWRARFTHGDPVLERGFDGFWVQPAVERAWLEVTGGLAR